MDYRKYYSITVSPRWRPMNPTMLCEEDYNALNLLLNKCSKHYILFPEFTELTSRLHYHGVIRIDDRIKFHHIKYKLDNIGITKIDKLKTPKDHISWLVYCMKDWAVNASQYKPLIYKRRTRFRKHHIEEQPSKGNILDWCQKAVSVTSPRI